MSGSGDKRGRKPSAAKKRSRSPSCKGERNSKVQRPAPSSPLILPPKDCPGKFRYVELPNSLRVLLICNLGDTGKHPADPYWTQKFPSASCHEDANFLGRDPLMPADLFMGCDPEVFEIVEDGPALLVRNFHERHSEDATSFMEEIEQIRNEGTKCLELECGGGGEGSRPTFGLALSVNCGSHSDPTEFQGLAHLVEHLVHYGCASYPDDASFVNFINDNAGIYNAFTGSSFTNYHCAIRNSEREVIEEACARYAEMLSKPLFNSDLVARELEAVDTEFYMRRSNQFVQANYLIPNTTINGSHPMKNFDCGSKEYLLPQGIDKELAIEKLKAACHSFLNQNYTGANMTLVVQGPLPLDALQTIVTSSFGTIPKGTKLRRDLAPSSPYDMCRFNSLYTIKPTRSNKHELLMQWTFPAAVANDYDTKAAHFVAKFLRHQKPGGIAHQLKAKGWIVDLEALVHASRFSTDLYFYMELTQRGRDELGCVLQTVFTFLKLLKCQGPNEADFQEMKALDQFRFDNMALDRSLWGLIRLSVGIHKYKVADIAVGGTFLKSRFDPKAITTVLDELVPCRANYILFTWDVKNPLEPYPEDVLYKTQFVVEKLSDDMAKFLTKGKQSAFLTCLPKNTIFSGDLPAPPCLVPGTLTQLQIRTTSTVMSYYLPKILATPQGVYIVVLFPTVNEAYLRKNDVLLTTWVTMLNLELIPKLSSQAEMGTSVFVSAYNGVLLFLYRGFTAGLLEAMTTFIGALQSPLKEEAFLAARETVRNTYFHEAANSFKLGSDYLTKLKEECHETLAEKFEKADSLSLSSLKEFVQAYIGDLRFLTIAQGYIGEGLERCLAKLLGDIPTGNKAPSYALENEYTRPTPVADGTRCLRLKSLLDSEKVFAVMNYYEIGGGGHASNEELMMTYIVYLGLRKIVFNELRTKEQLGYAVYVVFRRFDPDSCGIVIVVGRHSDKHCPCYIDGRMDALLQTFYDRDLEDHVQLVAPSFSSAKIQAFYKKNFLPGILSGMRKLTIQITGRRGQPMAPAPCQSGQVTPLCKKSIWMKSIHTLGRQQATIALANDPGQDDSLSILNQIPQTPYFIRDFQEYHAENHETQDNVEMDDDEDD